MCKCPYCEKDLTDDISSVYWGDEFPTPNDFEWRCPYCKGDLYVYVSTSFSCEKLGSNHDPV